MKISTKNVWENQDIGYVMGRVKAEVISVTGKYVTVKYLEKSHQFAIGHTMRIIRNTFHKQRLDL